MTPRFRPLGPPPSPLALPAPAADTHWLGEASLIGSPDRPFPFGLTAEDLSVHTAVLGGSGRGKSKLLEQLCREFIRNWHGFLFIDPHSNTSRELLAYLHVVNDRLHPLQRLSIHYLEPTMEQLFALDPFVYSKPIGRPGSGERLAYLCWFASQVDRMKRLIIRQQGEANLEGMPRLNRWAGNALYAVGVATGESGGHLGMHELLTILNPQDPRFPALFERVAPHLSPEVLADFRKLIAEKAAKKQEEWVESSLNRFRAFLNPLTRQIFSGRAKPFDIGRVMAQDGIVLCSLGETENVSADQTDALGGILIAQAIQAARTLPREGRNQFHLVVDEAERFLGDDLRRGFGELRKMKLSLCLGVQDLSCLKKGDDLDLVPKVLSQCGVTISFQQKFPPDAELLADTLGWKALRFDKLLLEQDRPDGYDWVPTASVGVGSTAGSAHGFGSTESRSASTSTAESDGTNRSVGRGTAVGRTAGESLARSESRTTGTSVGRSDTASESHGTSEGTSHSSSRGWSHTTTAGEARTAGRSHSEGVSESHSASTGQSVSAGAGSLGGRSGHAGGLTRSSSESRGSGTHRSTTESESTTRSRSESDGTTGGETTGHSSGTSRSSGRATSHSTSATTADTAGTTRGENSGTSHTTTDTRSDGESHSRSRGETSATSTGLSTQHSHTRGGSLTVTAQLTPLGRHRTERVDTGKLIDQSADQLALFQQVLMTLPPRTCVVSSADSPTAFVMRVSDVADPFAGWDELKGLVISAMRKRLAERHEYLFVPAAAVAAPRPGADEPHVIDVTAVTKPTRALEKNPYGQ